MSSTEQGAEDTVLLSGAALVAARSLAEAIGESTVYRRFEAAQEAFEADDAVKTKLRSYQARQQDLRVAAMWGGASRERQQALEREWEELSRLPTLRTYLEAQEAVRELFREVAGRITQEIGVDYGAACSPAGGCC